MSTDSAETVMAVTMGELHACRRCSGPPQHLLLQAIQYRVDTAEQLLQCRLLNSTASFLMLDANHDI